LISRSNKLIRVGSEIKIEISKTYIMEVTPYFFRILIFVNKTNKIVPAKIRLINLGIIPDAGFDAILAVLSKIPVINIFLYIWKVKIERICIFQ
jgi:hypothetical protein